MQLRSRNSVFLSLLFQLVFAMTLFAQTNKEVQYVKGYMSGHEFQITYCEGGAAYGTFFFMVVHFCASGQYLSAVQSRKQTVLGNEQVNNWNDGGSWDVVILQGHAALQYVSISGTRDLVPMEVLPDGGVRPLFSAFMQRIGKAQCK